MPDRIPDTGLWRRAAVGWDATMPPAPSAARSAAREGLVAMAPLALGVGPFGLVVGASSVEAGLSVGQAAGFSLFVFAGAAQLAAIDLLASGAPLLVTVATALVINLRMVMYSASLAPHTRELKPSRRLAMSYLLVDQAYALSIVRWERHDDPPRARFAFYAAVAVPLWLLWQATTLLGALFGRNVPEGIPLSFTVTLVFLAVLVPALTDRPRIVAAVVAAGIAAGARGLPADLSLIVGAVCGIAAGAWCEARSR